MIFLNKLKKYEVKSNAKINIGLNVYEKYENSYHNIDTIMLPIDLCDELEIVIYDKSGTLSIECSSQDIPTDKRNILYKTYELFFTKSKMEKQEIFIKLKKNIPTEAGLGGGSSNASCFLKILNSHYNNIFTREELKKLALKIGSDVPFFLENKTSRVSGMGDAISVVENNLTTSIILIKPNFGVSTKEAYDNFDDLKLKKFTDFHNIELALKNNNVLKLEENIENCLEQGILVTNEKIRLFRKKLEDLFSDKKFFMSGSGSTYYMFVTQKEKKDFELKVRAFGNDIKFFTCDDIKQI